MKTKLSSPYFFVICVFFAAAAQLQAQGNFSGGQALDVNFSAVSGAATNQPSGGASYFQTGWDYTTSSSVSNLFIIAFNVGSNAASDGWILQMIDGSLSPVFELTNEVINPFPTRNSVGSDSSPTSFPYYYDQNWQLTDNQVQNLLAGNWYAEIDYGGNTYLGNLMPVPEPETLTLFGLGVAALFIRRRK